MASGLGDDARSIGVRCDALRCDIVALAGAADRLVAICAEVHAELEAGRVPTPELLARFHLAIARAKGAK